MTAAPLQAALDAKRDDDKRRATLSAVLALRGYELRELESGALLIVRWGLGREFATLDAVERFGRQVGAIT